MAGINDYRREVFSCLSSFHAEHPLARAEAAAAVEATVAKPFIIQSLWKRNDDEPSSAFTVCDERSIRKHAQFAVHSDGTQPKVYVDLEGAVTGLKLVYVSVYLLETKISNSVGDEHKNKTD